MILKNRSHKHDINRPRSRHGRKYSKYKKCLTMMCLYVWSNTWATFEAQFMKNLKKTEAELKKSVTDNWQGGDAICDDRATKSVNTWKNEDWLMWF